MLQSLEEDNSRKDTTSSEIYETVRSEVRRAIADIQDDLQDVHGNGARQQLISKKENLCLYGFPSEQWEVNLPAEEVPPELPEPALGINFGMQEKDWLSLVAVHSDAWLLSVAFYFGARFGFEKAERSQLHSGMFLIGDIALKLQMIDLIYVHRD